MTESRDPVLLVVEDNLADVELLRYAFEEQGIAVNIRTAIDGEEALRAVDAAARDPRARPDLVVLDLNMPRVHGRDVLERLRSHEQLRDVPVVVLTTSPMPQDRERCLALGATDFQVKPTLPEDLLALAARIAKHLGPSAA